MDPETIATAYYRALYSPAHEAAISEYLTDDYVEHQFTAGFTKSGLADYVRLRLKAYPHHEIIIHKRLHEGEFVFLLAEEKLGASVDIARAELFRFHGDKIAEHWGAHVLDEKNRKNPHGTFDGPLPNRTVDTARRVAPAFEALDLRGFGGQEIECFYETRTPDYIQHSPKGADGLDGLVNILGKMKAAGMKMTMAPKRILADGDFLMSHRLYDTSPPHPLANRINTFDLFRFNADGKAAEHWDVMEDVPSEELLAKVF